MKSLDKRDKEELEIKNSLMEAIENGDSEKFAMAQVEVAKGIEQRLLQEAKSYVDNSRNDAEIRNQRGLHLLTVEEKKFYNEVITAGGFTGAEQLVPSTVFDRVFEDLRKEHPLLNKIQFVNTTGVTEWVSRDGEVAGAWWGKLCDEITKKLEMAFTKETTNLYKLSAYLPVCKAMLDLGPDWLDRFVREVLAESIAIALEEAIVKGDGDGKPIGMNKDLEGSVVSGVYPDKTAVELADLSPKSLGEKIMLPMTVEGTRTVSDLIMVINPMDYWGKVFPQTTVKTLDGSFVHNVLPIPIEVIESIAVPVGTMIVGRATDYFMGIGSEQVIDYSDHYRFLDDERVYIAKQYANGKPKDNDAFIVFDISTMGDVTPEVPEA